MDEILRSRIDSIARKYGSEAEDVASAVVVKMLELELDPEFAGKGIGYKIKRARWEASRYANRDFVRYDRYTVAVDVYLDVLAEDMEAFDAYLVLEAQGGSVEEQVIRREMLSRLESVLQSLPAGRRRIAEAMLHGEKGTVIARQLGYENADVLYTEWGRARAHMRTLDL